MTNTSYRTNHNLLGLWVGSAHVTSKEALLAINHAVAKGKLDYRVDHLYLPQAAAAD